MMRSRVDQNHPGTGNEIAHRARHQYFIGRRGGRYARADVNRDSHCLLADPLAFAAMEARSYLQTKRRYRGADVEGGSYGLGRRIEHCEKPIARIRDFAPAKRCQRSSDDRVELSQLVAPLPVA